jgi:quinol monooxygenase YgiN
MKFSQHIVFYAGDEHAVLDLLSAWNADDGGAASGFLGVRVMRFRDKPGRYVVQADFESWEAAAANNERPETNQWAERLRALADGEPKYENLDVLARL